MIEPGHMQVKTMTDASTAIIATHNLSLVILSVVIAIIASYTALNLSGRVTVAQGLTRTAFWLVGGAIAMGVGIWSMHFIAMLAYNLPIPMVYNFPIVLVSMAVAVVASGAALFVVSRQTLPTLQFLAGGIFMGLGIATMHYTGMAAMRMEASAQYDPKLVALSIVIAIGASLIALRLAFDLRTETTVSGSVRKIGSAIIMGIAITGTHYTAMAAINLELPSHGGSLVDFFSFKPTNQLLWDNSLLGVGIGIATLVILSMALMTCHFDQRISIETTRTQALRQSEDRFRSLVQNSSDIIVVVAASGTVCYTSQSVKRILGYEPDDWKKAFEVVHPDDLTKAESLLMEALRYPALSIAAECRLRHADGQARDFEVIFNNLLTEPGVAGIVTTYRDITERKRAEEEIKKLNESLNYRAIELEAANKELEAFSYSVSHDLRAPLRAINGFSSILLNKYAPGLPAEATHYLQMVQDNAQQMGCLIDDLLTFSRLSRLPLKKQLVHSDDLVRQALANLHYEQENRHVEISLNALPVAQADSALLKQVWVNLLSNALKFTRLREVACITVGYQQIDGDRVYFVKDNGVGFDIQYAHKLFGVFQRLHRAEDYEGTGVGLAIVERIIHRHGGRVWAEGEVNKGATFYFTLGGNVSHDTDRGRNPVGGRQPQRCGIDIKVLFGGDYVHTFADFNS